MQSEDVKKLQADLKKAKAENSKLRKENKAARQRQNALETANNANVKHCPAVVGEYKAKNGKTYEFKPGFKAVRVPDPEALATKEELQEMSDPLGRLNSEKVLQHAGIMEKLIEINFFGIREVEA